MCIEEQTQSDDAEPKIGCNIADINNQIRNEERRARTNSAKSSGRQDKVLKERNCRGEVLGIFLQKN